MTKRSLKKRRLSGGPLFPPAERTAAGGRRPRSLSPQQGDVEGPAVGQIEEYLRELADAVAAGDDDLECAILSDGIDILVDADHWCLSIDEDGWFAVRPTYESSLPGVKAFGDGDLMGLVGPRDLAPAEIVRRLRTLELQRIDPD